MKIIYIITLISFISIHAKTDSILTTTTNQYNTPLIADQGVIIHPDKSTPNSSKPAYKLPVTQPLYQAATNLINLIQTIDTTFNGQLLVNFLNLKDIQFFEKIIDQLNRLDWLLLNKQIPMYVQAFNNYQAQLKALRKQRENTLKDALNKNTDAHIVAQLIAPEELQKMLQNKKITQYSIKPEAIKNFFTTMKNISDKFKRQKNIIKDNFLATQKNLSIFQQLALIRDNIIDYLNTRTDNKTIQKGLKNIKEKSLLEMELWKGFASLTIQILVEHIAATYIQESKSS